MNERDRKISLTEFKELITFIKDTKNIDFSDYALTSLKRRIERVLSLYNFVDLEEFTQKINKDNDFFDIFLKDISVPTTEMFRDPTMWIELKDKIFPRLRNKNQLKIWIPEATSDDELFSLVILLKELDLLGSADIYATCLAQRNVDLIKSGNVDLKIMEVNAANYIRQDGNFQLSKYFDIEERRAVLIRSLISDVKIFKHDFFNEKPVSDDFNLILFRNRMIYYNPLLQSKAVEIVCNSLAVNGYLITGVNETIEGATAANRFQLINKTEKIFRKQR